MKNKNEKPLLSIESEKDTLGDQSDEMSVDKKISSESYSWLLSTADLGEDELACQARSLAAEIFMQTMLVPLVNSHKNIDESMVVDLLVEFKQTRKQFRKDFEISQVAGSLLNRFQSYLIQDTDEIPSSTSDILEADIRLFISIANLDFQFIDNAVNKRLNIG